MLSVPHLIMIFVVALVFFGPEKLPELARNLGKVMAEFRRATGDIRSTFEDHLRDLEREADDRRIGSAPSQPSRQLETSGAASSESAPPNVVPTTAPGARLEDPLGVPHAGDDPVESAWALAETNAPADANHDPAKRPDPDKLLTSASPHNESDSHLPKSDTKSETVTDGHS
ncbi:MAG TPA: twin-arginine translocase TatA/TatE family subunit [Candidatus Acidoferrales bacterium]|nr:twin-arginine translocase TatA/TatE family subunit [Candidatus Acidoferrales bacterium]